MMQAALVVDANILIRAVLGTRVRGLIQAHAVSTRFFAPDTAFDEARRHLPALMKKRGVDPAAALSVLTALEGLVQVLEPEVYGARQPCLDRGRRLFWNRGGYLDFGSDRIVSEPL
jgi:predicted nucleic acid-binding protein